MARVKLIVDKDDIAPEHHALFDDAGGAARPDQRPVHGRAAQPRPGPALERDQRVSPPRERRRGAARRARRLRDGPREGLRLRLERPRDAGAQGRRARGDHRRGPRSARPVAGLPDAARAVVLYVRQLLQDNRVESDVFDQLLKAHDPEMAGRADGLDRPLRGALRHPERVRGHAGRARGRAARRSRARGDADDVARPALRAPRHADHPARSGGRTAHRPVFDAVAEGRGGVRGPSACCCTARRSAGATSTWARISASTLR